MSRIILTFENLFQVLAADKVLRADISCRPTPTPAGLATAICGVSIELLDHSQKDSALTMLDSKNLPPNGIHELP